MKIETKSTAPDVPQSWETYWHGTAEFGAYGAGGAGHPAIHAFWEQFFRSVSSSRNAATLLDIASGNGAVVECARDIFGDDALAISCVDVSAAAIANIHNRFPGVRGLVCDARAIPLEAATFDVVVSQFGVEYAGPRATGEAARLLAPGGHLALLLHHRAGAIHRECMDGLEALSRLQESRFIPLAIEMFQAGFAAIRGADRGPYDAAAARLAPAVEALEAIIARHGPQVAGDTIARLYRDVGRIHGKLQHYVPEEVLGWLHRMEQELVAYTGRLSSMLDSALDQESFQQLCTDVQNCGCMLKHTGPLTVPGAGLPLAWALVASRPSSVNVENNRDDA